MMTRFTNGFPLKRGQIKQRCLLGVRLHLIENTKSFENHGCIYNLKVHVFQMSTNSVWFLLSFHPKLVWTILAWEWDEPKSLFNFSLWFVLMSIRWRQVDLDSFVQISMWCTCAMDSRNNEVHVSCLYVQED